MSLFRKSTTKTKERWLIHKVIKMTFTILKKAWDQCFLILRENSKIRLQKLQI